MSGLYILVIRQGTLLGDFASSQPSSLYDFKSDS